MYFHMNYWIDLIARHLQDLSRIIIHWYHVDVFLLLTFTFSVGLSCCGLILSTNHCAVLLVQSPPLKSLQRSPLLIQSDMMLWRLTSCWPSLPFRLHRAFRTASALLEVIKGPGEISTSLQEHAKGSMWLLNCLNKGLFLFHCWIKIHALTCK